MVAFRRQSLYKNIQRKKKTSKTLSIQELREKLIKSKNDIVNKQINDDFDEEKTYNMQNVDSDDDEFDIQDEFIDEEYEILNAKAKLTELFTQKGLIEYLISTTGGGKLVSAAATSMKRLIDYILWMHKNLNDKTILTYEAKYIFDSLYMIILKDHIGMIVKYCSHLEDQKELAPQTIKNTLYDIKSCSYWYLMIYQKTPNVAEIWLPLDNLITKCCFKANKKDRKMKSSGKNIEAVIADRRWPVNGLKELQQSCVDEIAKYNDMNKATFIDERLYNEFMRLLYATYYVFNVQGRVGAFTTLTYAQGGEMVHTGSTTSSSFKTNYKYGFQPISLCDKTKRLLKLYLTYFRPKASKGNGLTRPKSPLFITWNGDSDDKIGRKVTSFFEDKNDLHMTSTAIRGLMETTAEEALLRGDITASQRASVSSINGHSSAVVKNYYLKVRTAKDVQNARDAVRAFDTPNAYIGPHGNANIVRNNLENHYDDMAIDEDDSDANAINDDGADLEEHLLGGYQITEYADWGNEHPDYNKPVGSKASWSKSELSYIQKAAKEIFRSNPGTTNIVARILLKIKSDPLALPLFHARHVLKSDRLRPGYRQIEDKLNID